ENEWDSIHDGPIGKDDESCLAAVSDDGKRLYVSGWDTHTDGAGQERADTVTIAYDALTGGEQWQVRFDGDPQLLDYPRAIGVVGDRVVITGSSIEPFVGGQDIQTVVYRDNREGAAAEELWRARYDGGEGDQPLFPCLSRQVPVWFGLMGSFGVCEELVAVGATRYLPGTYHAVGS